MIGKQVHRHRHHYRHRCLEQAWCSGEHAPRELTPLSRGQVREARCLRASLAQENELLPTSRCLILIDNQLARDLDYPPCLPLYLRRGIVASRVDETLPAPGHGFPECLGLDTEREAAPLGEARDGGVGGLFVEIQEALVGPADKLRLGSCMESFHWVSGVRVFPGGSHVLPTDLQALRGYLVVLPVLGVGALGCK